MTSEQTQRTQSALVRRFVRALKRGYEEAAANPQVAVDVLLERVPEADPDIDRPGATLLSPLWVEEDTPFGWQTTEKWVRMTDWMKVNGLLPEEMDPGPAFNNRFIEVAQ